MARRILIDQMGKRLQRITELPTFVKVDDNTDLAGVPVPSPVDLPEAKERLAGCRVPMRLPNGEYLRTLNDQSATILELVRFNQPWQARTSWITRTRNLLPRRSLYSRDLPIEVAPQDLRGPCIHPNAPTYFSNLWRYMDLWKFEHLLQERAIFLARSDLVSDSREASLSFANLRYRPQVYRRQPKMARRHAAYVRELPNMKRWTYLSCWRVDQDENERSWTEYTTTRESVAIRTTYRKLLEYTATIFCAGVEYIDYSDTWVIETHPNWPFMYKAKDCEWEQEFRVIIQRFPKAKLSFDDALYYDCAAENRNCGLIYRVDLAHFIDEVRVSPNSPDAFFQKIQRLCADYGLGDRVSTSAFLRSLSA